jgi:DNA-binding response OmpR family regulator
MKKVIIIEDDPIVAHIYRTRLEKEGYSVETCADGQNGFYRIHEFNPDAVLLDLMLPKMNGVDILKKIRAQSKYGRIPIVVFTNAYVPNMIQEAFSAGASQVFNKATITPRQILDALNLLLFTPGGESTAPLITHYPTIPGMGSVGPTPGGGGTGGEGPAVGGNGGGGEPSSGGSGPAGSGPGGSGPGGPGPGGWGPGGTGGAGGSREQMGHADPLSDFGEPSFHSPGGPVHLSVANSYQANPHGYSPEMLGQPAANAAAILGISSGINADDSAFQADLYHAFVKAMPETLATLRKHLQEFTKSTDEKARLPHLLELYRKVHALTGSAGIAGFGGIAHMTAALEVLLKELHEKPKNINASTLRTTAHSIDFLGEMFRATEPDHGQPPPANILVVDDEILSRRAITYALEKANLKSVNLEDPTLALKMTTDSRFDLIFLDVQMPGMDGFELCQKIRSISVNRGTPIIFVTSLTDFKSRAKSSLSGGSDLIAKPFMFIELTVKALTHVLRGRLAQRQKPACQGGTMILMAS